jgi:UDP-N-acetylglucosamine pyrophosphorylase
MNAHQMTPLSNTLEDGSNVPVVPAEAQKCKMFIMTSPDNHLETVNFFKEHCFFGG